MSNPAIIALLEKVNLRSQDDLRKDFRELATYTRQAFIQAAIKDPKKRFTEVQMLSRLSVGGLLLEPVEGWQFCVAEDVITGSHPPVKGMLRIAIHAPNTLPSPLTHADCLIRACRLGDTSWCVPFGRRTTETVTGPLGAASYHRRGDKVRVYYCSRPPGLIVGAYFCSWAEHRAKQQQQALFECELMVFTAIFDRIAWGADDVLTRVLAENLDRVEQVPVRRGRNEAPKQPAPQSRASSGKRFH